MVEHTESCLQKDLAKFNRISKVMNDVYHEVSSRHGVSDSTFDILYSIYELGDGCLQRDICKVSYLAKQTVHSAIRKLEKEEMLTLEAGKGRQMHIRLTAKGQEKIQEFILPIIHAEEDALQALSEDEITTLLKLFERYTYRLRENMQNV